MPCCKKKRRLMEARRRAAEDKSLKRLKSMQNKNLTSLDTKLLLDYHKQTHLIYAGAITRKPLNKPFINTTTDLHDTFVKEIFKRGKQHDTPLKKV